MVEKDKEIKMHQVKLREFMQKNLDNLPVKAFDEIEGIMQAEETLNQSTTRKMADTYKKLRI